MPNPHFFANCILFSDRPKRTFLSEITFPLKTKPERTATILPIDASWKPSFLQGKTWSLFGSHSDASWGKGDVTTYLHGKERCRAQLGKTSRRKESKVGESKAQQKCVVLFWDLFIFCQKPLGDALFFYGTISAPPNLTVPRCCGAACCCCGRCCDRRGCPSKEPHRLRATARSKRGSQGARPIAVNFALSCSDSALPASARGVMGGRHRASEEKRRRRRSPGCHPGGDRGGTRPCRPRRRYFCSRLHPWGLRSHKTMNNRQSLPKREA